MTGAELARREKDYRRAVKMAEVLREERNAAVAEAASEGMTHAQIARATGLTRGRIGQLRMVPNACASISDG